MAKNQLTHSMARIAIFGALSGVLYSFLKFPLPFLPTFLELTFSDVPALIASYAFGPLIGGLVQVVKVFIKIILVGTSTAYVGEFADIIFGIAIVVPTAIYYQKHRNFKGAIVGIIIGGLVNLVVTSFGNLWVMLPFYVQFYFNGDASILLSMVQSTNASITNVGWSLVLWGILPFNIIKNTIIIVITFLVYKRISPIIKKI